MEKRHLCASTEEVQKAISTASIDKEDFLVKIDVQEFYLRGQHSTIADKKSACTLDRRATDWVRDALLHTLHYQRCSHDGESFVEVVTGSGIGSGHSGDCADLLFACLVEDFILQDQTRNKLGVKL